MKNIQILSLGDNSCQYSVLTFLCISADRKMCEFFIIPLEKVEIIP